MITCTYKYNCSFMYYSVITIITFKCHVFLFFLIFIFIPIPKSFQRIPTYIYFDKLDIIFVYNETQFQELHREIHI